MDDERILYIELEALLIKFRRLRDREHAPLKARALSIVVTQLEIGLAYYAYYVMGVAVESTKPKGDD